MSVLVYLPFVACAIAAATARTVARRTAPQLSAPVLALTGVVLAAATAAALALLALAVVVRIPLVATHGHWSSAAVARAMSVPTWIGGFAIGCIGAIAINAIRTLQRYRRSFGGALRLQRENAGTIVMVSDPEPFAYACRASPFRPGVIVVSDGLQRRLDEDQRAVVLAHEQSHLSHQHSAFEFVALLASAFNPCLVPVQREIGFSLERWADEDAATAHGRQVAASALAASAVSYADTTPVASLSHASSNVPARVHALLDNPCPTRRLAVAAALLNATLAAFAVVWAAHSVDVIFDILRH